MGTWKVALDRRIRCTFRSRPYFLGLESTELGRQERPLAVGEDGAVISEAWHLGEHWAMGGVCRL